MRFKYISMKEEDMTWIWIRQRKWESDRAKMRMRERQRAPERERAWKRERKREIKRERKRGRKEERDRRTMCVRERDGKRERKGNRADCYLNHHFLMTCSGKRGEKKKTRYEKSMCAKNERSQGPNPKKSRALFHENEGSFAWKWALFVGFFLYSLYTKKSSFKKSLGNGEHQFARTIHS